jgi:hypothetical protein
MSPDREVPVHAPRAWLKPALLGALGALALAWAASSLRGGEPAPEGPVTTLRPSTNVVSAVRELATLETVSFHMERVIDLRERKSQLFGLVQAEDAILLVAAADAVAGVDLRELAEGDVKVSEDRLGVSVQLPPPRLISVSLDNQRTYVHTRATDTLAKRSEELETKARQEAERTLGQAALDAGILVRARGNAARTVEGLLRSLGFQQIEVDFRKE